MSTAILAINYGGHDTSAAAMVDGELVAACEQERYDLTKHSRAFPMEAAQDCLDIAGIGWSDVSEIALSTDVIRGIRETYIRPALHDEERIGFLIRDIQRIEGAYGLKDFVREKTGYDGAIRSYRHHLCHLASAYYPSGFDRAILVSHDGIGEIEASMIGVGDGGGLEIVDDNNRYPHSLGLLYSAITFYLGWQHHCDEGIIMGLAPYGDPHASIPGDGRTYHEVFSDILRETGPLSYEVNQAWMAYYEVRDKWVSDQFVHTFGEKRAYDGPIHDHHKNVAAALQLRLEEVVLKQLQHCRETYDISNIGIAGGVGLNCSMNGKILASGLFDSVFVQPAGGDAGIAVGACYLAQRRRDPDYQPKKMHDFYLGHRADQDALDAAAAAAPFPAEKPDDLYAAVADRLMDGKIVGWYQGGAEFGPRALGNRSILCRPFPAGMKDHINARVKFREAFRPFAPAVLDEFAGEYFVIDQESPHMLMAVKVQPSARDRIPAVVHVDDSCRVQTVRAENNARFRSLLEAFHERSGIPVLLNTSFNVKGQPIVNTPQQAVDCFAGTEIDCLVIGDYLIDKPSKG